MGARKCDACGRKTSSWDLYETLEGLEVCKDCAEREEVPLCDSCLCLVDVRSGHEVEQGNVMVWLCSNCYEKRDEEEFLWDDGWFVSGEYRPCDDECS